MTWRRWAIYLVTCAAIAPLPALAQDAIDPAAAFPPDSQYVANVDATAIVRAAVDHWRGLASYSEMTMSIHRSDWERSMTLAAWTKGDENSLVRVLEPARDRGNATLTRDNDMWSYSPRINRVVRIPSSMMAQSWMGSDFSNRDVARSDDIVDEYTHTLLETTEVDGLPVYTIESIPHEDAAVVWGREELRIRADHVVLEHRFFDQDDELVKTLTSLSIREMGGRTIADVQRMQKTDAPKEWTEIRVNAVDYDVALDDRLFTLSSLGNPRQ